MEKEEFKRKVAELTSMKIALFTDEIRNSDLYCKYNMDSELPTKLEKLKKECDKFKSLSNSVILNLNEYEMKERIRMLNDSFDKIKFLLNDIDWNQKGRKQMKKILFLIGILASMLFTTTAFAIQGEGTEEDSRRSQCQ